MEELNFFNYDKKPLKIDKPVRLIELFAGIGSQAKALERLGADFEHYRVCEFDKYAIKSYNAIHGTDFETSDITQITADDLGIVDTDKYCYIMTYSFPCQDLSLAGKQKGMAKGENTRSGLLWEVERLLNECEELPQVLLMENVTQVHGKKNKEHFDEWIEFLEGKGYSNYWKDLNAKNFGVPQNRNRTFMVSILGDYTYEFPKEFPLKLRLKDMLEDSVDEKYYLSGKMVDYLHNITEKNIARGNGNIYSPSDVGGCSKCITTKEGSRVKDNFIEEPKCEQVGMLSGGKWDKMHDISRRVYGGEGIAPTIHTCGGGNLEPKVVEPRVIGGIGEKKSNGGKQWYQQDRIYDNEVALSVTTGFLPYYKTEEPAIQKVDIPQTVRVRKYTVDCESLCKLLRERKKSLRLSTQDIADRLKNVPLTTVEHWFRQDNSFAIPDETIWFKLKSLLRIETNEFDEAITVFEEREGVFEKSNRCYFSNGIAPTITSASADEKIVEPTINVIGNYSPSGHDASRIVATDGLAPTVKENHGTVTAITEPVPFDYRYDEGVRVRQDGCMPTLNATHTGTTSMSGQGFIAEPLAYDEQNGYIRKDGTVGTLTTDGSSPKHNNRVIENCYVSEKGVKYILDAKRGMATDVNADVSQPLTAKGQANWTGSFVSPDIESLEKSSTIGSTEPTKINLKDGTQITSNDNLVGLRIRKLTPKECWRLMGFDDADFEKAAQYNSNSQLYKQAGNSIVVDVLAHIFTKML